MPGIFINYRRADSIAYAELIYRQLVEQFGADNVFSDLEAIDLGQLSRDDATDCRRQGANILPLSVRRGDCVVNREAGAARKMGGSWRQRSRNVRVQVASYTARKERRVTIGDAEESISVVLLSRCGCGL